MAEPPHDAGGITIDNASKADKSLFLFVYVLSPPLYDFLRYIALLKYTIQSKVYQAYKNPVN